ncbi:MAG: hypothetical protein M0Z31_06685 [Clostridia bacterium]|nr:hypothetical protein [Clostridia bacterium]
MPVKFDAAVLDADFAIKIGKIESRNVIEAVLVDLVEVLYIHKYVYDNEVLNPPNVKKQLDKLISCGRAFVVGQSFLSTRGEGKELVYQQTRDLLKANHAVEGNRRKNWGEIVSLAFARTEGVKIVLSDERDLQSVADDLLNIGDEQDIKVIRIRDFIEIMKGEGYERKLCRSIWLISIGKDETLEHRKEVFDREIWT